MSLELQHMNIREDIIQFPPLERATYLHMHVYIKNNLKTLFSLQFYKLIIHIFI